MASPRKTISVLDAVVIMVGVVIGAMIFRAPSVVAANSPNELVFMLLWVAGGVISVLGALCYAELASTYPDAGGDYHFLHRAFGQGPAFLFAWARLAVIQTGSIALLAFVIGDYLTGLHSLGGYSSAIYATLTIGLFTVVNVMGIRPGKWTQHVLSASVLLGLMLIVVAGIALWGQRAAPLTPTEPRQAGMIGLAMVFILLTYGGWNETAYLSAEMRGSTRRIASAFFWGIGLITLVYLLANAAMLWGLGLEGVAASSVVAADVMRLWMGEPGAVLISLVVVVGALSTINATIFTGSRTSYALGRDFPLFGALGQWNGRDCPANALVVQGVVALALVFLGALTRTGFATMVDYTAPVFWTFFLLTGVSLFCLRRRDPHRERPFRVPLYPVTPLLFCAVCVYMLYSSLAYTGVGALVGVGVLVLGLPLFLLARVTAPTSLAPGSTE